MKTAMQELMDWIQDEEFHVTKAFVNKLYESLEKEKEQIMKAARVCNFEGMRQGAKTSEELIKYGEQYYNETYNQNK